ncbi:staphylopine uptake ABC transporter ATP-binding protein CntD [Halobacillus kuroshimensis]|uniref:staphylopine uptake ABC transporter ATP-binding protein CntD n=1 Tax=Halobacillus kuroshimensis TaxID=302481 RepID=UPI00042527CF|nr:ABC transporter ATP-binding protein [Halobacillus kuroshimensis]
MNLLEVRALKVWNKNDNVSIVQDSSFELKEGSCLAIVGESGSGKSVTCQAITRLNKPSLQQSGEILFKGEDLTHLSNKVMRKRRGKNICMIIQNGMSAFDPTCVVGVHLRETINEHFDWSKGKVEDRLLEAMRSVMLKHPAEILKKYPHQLSGGMLQRIMIALSIVLEPDIIIADEPTTALDTVSQYEVIEQFIKLRQNVGCSMIFVSHDLGVVRRIADEVLVMKDGAIVERGRNEDIFENPQHEYTKYLISTRRSLNDHFRRIMKEEL